MSRIAYVNGRYLAHHTAAIHVEDRGYQFSDGVYEVCEVRDARVIDQRRHLARLKRSLDELRMDMPMPEAALAVVMRECMRRNRLRDGLITEGSSSNAWIVTRGGKVVTRPADNGILRGITRTVLIDVIRAQGLELEERPFTAEEAYGAREAFLTSASQIVMPVIRIDEHPVGNGAPGLIATALRAEFHRYAEST